MPRPLRIALVRINQESNALSPLRTTLEDFRTTHFLEGRPSRPASHQAASRPKASSRTPSSRASPPPPAPGAMSSWSPSSAPGRCPAVRSPPRPTPP
ncbi:MAG: hypothetical protein R3F60_08350 [bacterium]